MALFRERASNEVVRMVLDDQTIARLRDAADARNVPVEELMALLLEAAAGQIDDLLGPAADVEHFSVDADPVRHK